jgi:hypothetical protein
MEALVSHRLFVTDRAVARNHGFGLQFLAYTEIVRCLPRAQTQSEDSVAREPVRVQAAELQAIDNARCVPFD